MITFVDAHAITFSYVVAGDMFNFMLVLLDAFVSSSFYFEMGHTRKFLWSKLSSNP